MSELEQLKKENVELKSKNEALESIVNGTAFLANSDHYYSPAVSDQLRQHLADIKADAIMEAADNWIIRKDDDYNTRRKLVEISNKLRGESCAGIKKQ